MEPREERVREWSEEGSDGLLSLLKMFLFSGPPSTPSAGKRAIDKTRLHLALFTPDPGTPTKPPGRLELPEPPRPKPPPLPRLPEKNFVHLWKTLQDMFQAQEETPSEFVALQPAPDTQKLFHAVSVVGTMLVQIGEIERTEREKKDAETKAGEAENGEEGFVAVEAERQDEATVEPEKEKTPEDVTANEDVPGWSVSYQQFIACFLKESVLVDFFEHRIDIIPGLEKLAGQRLRQAAQKQDKKDQQQSVFYV